MRGYELKRRRSEQLLTVIAVAAVAALLAFAAPAAAAPSSAGDPVRVWSVSRIDHGAGEVPVGSGAQVGGKLQEMADVGHLTFNLPLVAPYWNFLPRARAFGSVSSRSDVAQYSVLAQAPSRNPLRIAAPIGAVSRLAEYQAYVKRWSDGSLRVAVSGVLFKAVDATAGPGATQCVL